MHVTAAAAEISQLPWLHTVHCNTFHSARKWAPGCHFDTDMACMRCRTQMHLAYPYLELQLSEWQAEAPFQSRADKTGLRRQGCCLHQVVWSQVCICWQAWWALCSARSKVQATRYTCMCSPHRCRPGRSGLLLVLGGQGHSHDSQSSHHVDCVHCQLMRLDSRWRVWPYV